MVAAAADPRHLPHGPGVTWHTLETRFFDVHWVEGPDHSARATALRAAELCDPLWLRLTADAASVPRGRFDLVVSDATEGMVAYAVTGDRRVVIGTDPGAAVLRLRGRRDWVEDALAHELAHLVWDQRTSPFASRAGYGVEAVGVVEVGGLAAALDGFAVHDLPYGFSEGLAELGSERAGVNTFDERRSGLLASGALSDRLLTYDEWLVGVDKGDVLDAERAYQQGYAFARWLGEEYGADTLRELGDHLASHHAWSLSRALRQVTGVSGRVSWARHRGHLLAQAVERRAQLVAAMAPAGRELEAWPEPGGLSQADTDARSPPRRVEVRRESSGSFELFPRASPDGRFYVESKAQVARVVRVAGPVDEPRGPTAWLPTLTGLPVAFAPDRDAVLLTTDVVPGRPAWWPAGPRRTAIWEVGLETDDEGSLVAARHVGRVAREVPGTERARELAVSDRGTLVFVRHADGGDQLWSRPLRGDAESVPRSSFPPLTWLQSPTFSPDGRTVAVSVFRENRGELWLAELPEWRWHRVPLPFADVLDPTWSPRGLFATAAVDGTWQVIRVEPGSGSVVAWTQTLGGASTPFAGPEGALWFSEATAAGLKATELRAADQLPRAVMAPVGPVPVPLPLVPVGVPRPYRPRPVAPAVGPLVRLDTGPPSLGSAGGLRGAGGGWLDVHDAVDTWALSMFGLLGTTSGGSAGLTWSGAGVPLSLWASGAVTPGSPRWLGQLELSSELSWNESVTVTPALWWLAGDGLASRRLRLSVDPASVLAFGEAGLTGSLAFTVGHSTFAGAGVPWARAEGSVRSRTALGAALGPLEEQALALELAGHGGVTSAALDPRESLAFGGDLDGAWRPLAIEGSLPFPALPPWAFTGRHAVVGSGRLVLPVAPRLRRATGPVYTRGFELAPGLDGALGSDAVARLAAVAEVRWLARLQDRTWNSAITVAKTFDAAPVRVQLELGSALP